MALACLAGEGRDAAAVEIEFVSPRPGAVLASFGGDVSLVVHGLAFPCQVASFELNGQQASLGWDGSACVHDGAPDFSGPYTLGEHRTLAAVLELPDGTTVTDSMAFSVVGSEAERHRIGDAVNGAWTRFRDSSAGLFQALFQDVLDELVASPSTRDQYLAGKADRRGLNPPGEVILGLFLLGGILAIFVNPVFLPLAVFLIAVLLVSSVTPTLDPQSVAVQDLEVELDLAPTVGCTEDILAPTWGGGPFCTDLEPGEQYDHPLCPPPDHHPGMLPPSPFPSSRDGFRVTLRPQMTFDVDLHFDWMWPFPDEDCTAHVAVDPGTYFRGIVTPTVGPEPSPSDPRAAWRAGIEIVFEDDWWPHNVGISHDCTVGGNSIRDGVRVSLRSALRDALCDPHAFRIALDQAFGSWDVRAAKIPVPPGTYLSVHHSDGAWTVPLGIRVASDAVPQSGEPFARGPALGSGPLDPFQARPDPAGPWDLGLAVSDTALNSLVAAAFQAGELDRITGGGVQVDVGTTSYEVELSFGAPPALRIAGQQLEIDLAGLRLRLLEEDGTVLSDAVLGALLEAQVAAGPAGRLWLSGFSPRHPYAAPDWIRTVVVLEGSAQPGDIETLLETFVIGPVVLPALREALFAIRPPTLGSDLAGVPSGAGTRRLAVADAAFENGWAYLYLDVLGSPALDPPVPVFAINQPVRVVRGQAPPDVVALCFRDPDGDAIVGPDTIGLGHGLVLLREGSGPGTERECWRLAGTLDVGAPLGSHEASVCATDATGRSGCTRLRLYFCSDASCPVHFDGVSIAPPGDTAEHVAVDIEDGVAVLQHFDRGTGLYGIEFVDLAGPVPVRLEGPLPDAELPNAERGFGPSSLAYTDWSAPALIHRDLSGAVPVETSVPDPDYSASTPLQPTADLIGWTTATSHAVRLCSPTGSSGFPDCRSGGFDEYAGALDLLVFGAYGITATPVGLLFYGRETLLGNKTSQGIRLVAPGAQGGLAGRSVVQDWICYGANCGPPPGAPLTIHYRYTGDGQLVYARLGAGTIEGCQLARGGCTASWSVPIELDDGSTVEIASSPGAFDASEELVAFLEASPPTGLSPHIYVYDRSTCTLSRLTATASVDRLRGALATSGRWVTWWESSEDANGNWFESVRGAEVPYASSRCSPEPVTKKTF